MNTTSVWLIDADPELGKTLTAGFQHYPHMHLSRIFNECRPALKKLEFESSKPDIIIFDLHLPDINGIKAMPLLRRLAPKAKLMTVTTDNRSLSVYRTMVLGARAYMLKPTALEDLVKACETVQRGGIVVDASVITYLLKRLPVFKDPHTEYRLTQAEQHLLPYLVQGLTDQEMADSLKSSFHTVRNHVRSIHSKLRTTTRTELVSKLIREELA